MDLDRTLEDEYLRIRYNIKLSDRVRELISHSSDDASMVLNHLFNRKNSKKSMLPAENELNRCNWSVSIYVLILCLGQELKDAGVQVARHVSLFDCSVTRADGALDPRNNSDQSGWRLKIIVFAALTVE